MYVCIRAVRRVVCKTTTDGVWTNRDNSGFKTGFVAFCALLLEQYFSSIILSLPDIFFHCNSGGNFYN